MSTDRPTPARSRPRLRLGGPRLRFEPLEDRLAPAVVPFVLPVTVTTAPAGPVGLELHDFDGDGVRDALVPAFGTVDWLPQAGGGFGKGVTVAAVGAVGATAGDLDGDGDADVIVAESGVGLAWYPNDGKGNFGPRVGVAAVAKVAQVYLADLNGDGSLDAVANAQETGQVTWFANDGAGNFGPAKALPFGVPYTFGLAFADLDGDGDTDVAAANYPLNAVL